MSRRVCVSIRRLMLPFVSAAEERCATVTVVAPKLSEDNERPFGMRGNMLARISNVNTKSPRRLCPSGRALGFAGARVNFGAAQERTARDDLLVMLTQRPALLKGCGVDIVPIIVGRGPPPRLPAAFVVR